MEKRRTQQERREGTIRKLLDAATDTLIELGYAEASVQRICTRAELSQGALFRHFATREALMVAVGEDVGAKLLERYKKKFAALPKGANRSGQSPASLDGVHEGRRRFGEGRTEVNDVPAAMRLVRDACRSRLNQAWYELEIAARTNDNLQKALEPVARRYYADISAAARELLPELASKLGPSFDVLVATVIAVFDGETMHRFVVKEPALEDARFDLLAGALHQLTR
jgi:AcrR family transcriptional regulator